MAEVEIHYKTLLKFSTPKISLKKLEVLGED